MRGEYLIFGGDLQMGITVSAAAVSVTFANYNIDCCTEYRDHISKHFLKRVKTHKIQRADGICDLRAMVSLVHDPFFAICYLRFCDLYWWCFAKIAQNSDVVRHYRTMSRI
uniref:Uncharacterized protein n=1 Tax=Leptobrachium leishanense TaxID=445787 RepID=A0A8C5LT92_9ANUR